MALDQMMPIILNSDFEKIAEIDDYISFIWTRRYYKAGDFELCVDISKSEFLKIGNFVQRPGDLEAMIIEKVEIQRTDEASEMIIASGREACSILDRRVISTQNQITGRVLDGIIQLIDDNVNNPAIEARKIPYFVFAVISTSTAEIDAQYLGENLFDTICSLCETFSIGFRSRVYRQYPTLQMDFFDGKDRSVGQSENERVIFSDEFDNLTNCDYVKSIENYATDVLVGGEGGGTGRTMVWSAKDSKSGYERFEKFLDASNAVSNDHIITQETYEKQLEGLGLAEVTEYTTAFSGEVNFDSVNFGIDVEVGDIVTIENKKWGMYVNTRILEVIESVGEDGAYSIIPTFGT